MSIHISARKGEIEKIVLLPGDPLRAKFIAEHFLQDTRLVSNTRNALYFSGTYKKTPITVGASGMGCPSIGIYSYELYTEYEVETIIRIGTCGAYTTELALFDLVNVHYACSESTFARYAWAIKGNRIRYQGNAFHAIKKTARKMKLALKNCNVHSSDIFYRKENGIPKLAAKKKCLAVEMEAFALFANAQHLGKTAATLLTVSDVIPTGEKISADEREKALHPMIELALESSLKLIS
jgi:purine-nucleoside phosphorylase